MMQIRLATPADRSAVVDSTVEAFASDPAFNVFFGADYAELCARFAGYLFDRRVGYDSVWVAHDGQVVAMWDAPDAPNSVSGDHGEATLDLPTDAQERLDAYDRAVHDALPASPHWYLGVLACHPEQQGGGKARRVAEVGLARAAADGVPAFLETTEPRNVGIYERAGWETFAQIDDVVGLTVWVMRHPTVPPSSEPNRSAT